MVRDDPEQHAADGPADQEDGKNDPPVPSYGLRADGIRTDRSGASRGCQQVFQRGMEDDGVNRRVHGIEDPPEPGHQQDEPLIWSDAFAPGSWSHRIILDEFERGIIVQNRTSTKRLVSARCGSLHLML